MKLLTLSACLLAIASMASASSPVKPTEVPTSKVMSHDPVLAKQGDTYYLFATGQGISVMSSKDLKTWKFEKPVFAEAPGWAVETIKGYQGHTWAPDIIFHNGLYHLFFSLKTPLPSDMLQIQRSIRLTRSLNGLTTERSSSRYRTETCGMQSTPTSSSMRKEPRG